MADALETLRRRAFPWRIRLRAMAGTLHRAPPLPDLCFLAYSPSCVRTMSPLWEYGSAHPTELRVMRFCSLPGEGISGPGVLRSRRELLRLIDACRRAARFPLFVIALDSLDAPAHAWGRDLITYLRGLGAKTVCLQHGGTKRSTLRHLAFSASDFILTWGDLARDAICEMRPDRRGSVFVLGNPAHDHLNRTERNPAGRPQERIPVLLATCLHSEYGDESALYRRHLREVYGGCAAAGVPVHVIRHPRDPTAPDLYREVADSVSGLRITIDASGPKRFYELLESCETLLTRASTAAEEAMALGKRVIFYNLPEHDLAGDYVHLAGRAPVHFCQGAEELARLLKEPFVPPAQAEADAFSRFDGRCRERHFRFFHDVRTGHIHLPADAQ